jgi:hypothetical protein
MSIIVWDGKSIAADKQATNNGFRHTTTKLRRSLGLVLAYTGDQDSAEAMVHWFEMGADVEKYPAFQNDEKRWARLIIVSEHNVIVYERTPHPLNIEDAFMAWGAGRDYAIGALACGKSAREAVEITCRFDISCGMGVSEILCRPWTDQVE